uniref:Uncharacterized protein n=1 Tax=Arundo donax TaxID=35708 RepID=A0A0A9AYK0_ARUDO
MMGSPAWYITVLSCGDRGTSCCQ